MPLRSKCAAKFLEKIDYSNAHLILTLMNENMPTQSPKSHFLKLFFTLITLTLSACGGSDGSLFNASDLSEAEFKNEYPLITQTGNPAFPIRAPEGIGYDPEGKQFFATSIFGGKITRIDAKTGNETVFYQETANPFQAFSGIKVDSKNRLVWSCAVDLFSNPAGPVGQVYVFSIEPNQTAGKVLKVFNMPSSPFFCNDIALDQQGDAHVTNSLGASIMKITRQAVFATDGAATVFTASGLLAPDVTQPIVLGMNGISVTPDGKYLLVAITSPAKIFRISIANPSDIQPVTFTGDALSKNPNANGDPIRFLGPDGMVFLKDKLYVSYHGGVQQLSFNQDFTQASVKSTINVPTGLSTITATNNSLYVIKSETVPVTQPQLSLPVELPHKIVKVDLNLF